MAGREPWQSNTAVVAKEARLSGLLCHSARRAEFFVVRSHTFSCCEFLRAERALLTDNLIVSSKKTNKKNSGLQQKRFSQLNAYICPLLSPSCVARFTVTSKMKRSGCNSNFALTVETIICSDRQNFAQMTFDGVSVHKTPAFALSQTSYILVAIP